MPDIENVIKIKYDEWLNKDLWPLLAGMSILADFKIAPLAPRSVEEYLELSSKIMPEVASIIIEAVLNEKLHFAKTALKKENINALLVRFQTNTGEDIVILNKVQWNKLFNDPWYKKLIDLIVDKMTRGGILAEYVLPAEVLHLGAINNIEISCEFIDRFVSPQANAENKLISNGVIVRTFSEIGKLVGTKKRMAKEYIAIQVQRELDRGCTCDHLQLTEQMLIEYYDKLKHEFQNKKISEKEVNDKVKECIKETIKYVFKLPENPEARSRIKYDNKHWKQPPPCKIHT